MIHLHSGDCLEVMPQLQEKSINLILADLPYGTTNCKWDSIIPLDSLWQQYKRIIKENGAIVLFAAQPFTSQLIASNYPMFRYCWYWVKEKGTGFLNAKHQPMRSVEEICVFYTSRCIYNPQMVPLDKPYKHTLPISKSDINKNGIKSMGKTEREYVTYTHSFPKNILYYSRDKANKSLVPTQKPLELVKYLVKTYSNEDDTVLDNVMGSGTTGVACYELKRNFIGIEINKKHFSIAEQRLDFTLQ
jgi:DNA modification methylase